MDSKALSERLTKEAGYAADVGDEGLMDLLMQAKIFVDEQPTALWAAQKWSEMVRHRPLTNRYRSCLDFVWRMVIQRLGGDDVLLCGDRHEDLIAPYNFHLYCHTKTGGKYRILSFARVEADLSEVVIYQNIHSGDIWTRPKAEFFDGRFVRCEP